MEYSPAKAKGKKLGLISKTWERCKSFSGGIGGSSSSGRLPMKSKSWPRGLTATPNQETKTKKWSRVAPEGCFSVYVGPEKQRFVIKTEYVNHPLFKTLLEEAESEYGYSSHGPLMLPCEVAHFINVLMHMDSDSSRNIINIGKHKAGCNFVACTSTHTCYHLLTPPRLMDAMNNYISY